MIFICSTYLLFGSFTAFFASLWCTFSSAENPAHGEHVVDPVAVYFITLLLWLPGLVYIVWDTFRFIRERNVPYQDILKRRVG